MDTKSAVAAFSGLEPAKQLNVLAKFGHNMTIAAPDTYVMNSEKVRAPERLRAINETHHRVFGHTSVRC